MLERSLQLLHEELEKGHRNRLFINIAGRSLRSRSLLTWFAGMLDEITKYKKVLDAVGLKPDMDISGVAPPLDGIVTAVGERNLIEVSLGSDDGLRIGSYNFV